LIDAFGEVGFVESETLLRRFVPKNIALGNNCRPAAITALGKFHANESDCDLIPKLVRRMNDQVADPSESDQLCAACAIALGRMKAKSAVRDLNRYYDDGPVTSGMNFAAAWAIREITGEAFADPVAAVISKTGFNLEPGIARLELSEEVDSESESRDN
jgi:hypothetical protein